MASNTIDSFINPVYTNSSLHAPALSLEIRASSILLTTLPYDIDFTIRRNPKGDATDSKPCIFHWSPYKNCFIASGLLLLHYDTKTKTWENIPIEHETGVVESPEDADTLKVDGCNQFLWELSPGSHVTFRSTLPERYYNALISTSNVGDYKFVWPGGAIKVWDWGTVREHLGQELKAKNSSTAMPMLVLPGSAANQISFQVKTEEPPWPGREACLASSGFHVTNLLERQWRLERKQELEGPCPAVKDIERVHGAPILTVTLEGPETVTYGQTVNINVRITYMGTSDAHAITFHTYLFKASGWGREGYHLYYRQADSSTWKEYKDDEHCHLLFDDPDVLIRVGEHEDFVTLHHGESWTTSRQLWAEESIWEALGDDIKVGDSIRYEFKGILGIDWWDWGSKQEHMDTVVKVPSWITGRVVEPRDNGRRAKLVVPGSNVLELRVV